MDHSVLLESLTPGFGVGGTALKSYLIIVSLTQLKYTSKAFFQKLNDWPPTYDQGPVSISEKTRIQETFKLWYLVRLVQEVLR